MYDFLFRIKPGNEHFPPEDKPHKQTPNCSPGNFNTPLKTCIFNLP